MVSAHQPIGLYRIETTADQSPSENNGKHPKVTSRLWSSGGLPDNKLFFFSFFFSFYFLHFFYLTFHLDKSGIELPSETKLSEF